MQSRILRPLFALLASLFLIATVQGRTIVTGTISAADAEEVSIQVYEKYLNNTFKEYKITVVNRIFRIDNLPITEPRFVTLAYKGKKADFFIAPNDSLSLSIESGSFPDAESIVFAGKGAKSNQVWLAFNEIFGIDQYNTMYKNVNKGIFSYSLENSMATQMNSQDAKQFATTIEVERQNKRLTLDALDKQYGGLSPEFKEFMWAEINYDWAYKYLAYGYLQPKNNKLPTDYYESLLQTPVQNMKAMGNAKYQQYVLAYLNYLYHQRPIDGNAFIGFYKFIDQHLNAKAAELFKGAVFCMTTKVKDASVSYLYGDYMGKYSKGAYVVDIDDIYKVYSQNAPTTIAGQQHAANKEIDAKMAAQQAGTQGKPAANSPTAPNSSVYRKSRTVVTGFIDHSSVPDVFIHVNMRSLNNSTVDYKTKIQGGAFFKIDSIDIEEPRVVILEYDHNKVEVFLEPNDSLHIEIDANMFYNNMKFKGKAGRNNECYSEYRLYNPDDMSIFNMTTFRKGIYTYGVNTDLDERMRILGRNEMETRLTTERKTRKEMITRCEASKPGMSDAFRLYLNAEIDYDWAYKMLVYGYAYGEKNDLAADYWKFTEQVPVQNDIVIGNEKYQRYVMAYTNYWYMQNKGEGSPYIGQYKTADRLLNGKPLQYFRASLLVDAINNGNMETVVDNYKDFLYQNHNPYYAQILSDMYQNMHRYSSGSPAPPFALLDRNGKAVSLTDFKGKAVYLAFWATWCGACQRKMALMQDAERAYASQNPDVVFIHVSLDKNVSAWQNTLTMTNYPGLHLNSPDGPVGALAKSYGISALPEYYLISKGGQFAEKPASHDIEELKAVLTDLSKKNN